MRGEDLTEVSDIEWATACDCCGISTTQHSRVCVSLDKAVSLLREITDDLSVWLPEDASMSPMIGLNLVEWLKRSKALLGDAGRENDADTR